MKVIGKGGAVAAAAVLLHTFLLDAGVYGFKLPSKAFSPSREGMMRPAATRGEDVMVGSDQYRETPSLLKTFVNLLTSGINAATGAVVDEERIAAASNARLSPTALKNKIQMDYSKAYFVTGEISPEAYDANCRFTDPTISFSGLATWTRNIASLKQFLIEPRIDLYDIKLNQAKNTIETKWRLTTGIALPWKPFIDCEGSTVHRYDPTRGNRVVEHVESWEVSGIEAVLQMFKPGKGRRTAEKDAATSAKKKGGKESAFSKAGRNIKLLTSAMMPIGMGLLSTGLTDRVISPDTMIAHAFEDKREIANIPASGLIFKDTINIEAFADKKVSGVTLYVSDFRRPLAERLAKDFFSDPSQASITCVQSGPINIGNIDKSKEGEEVFTEARSLLFKTIRVRRIYDKQANALVYVSYSTRFSKNDDDNKSRFKSSLCAIPLRDDYGSASVEGGL